MKFGIFGDIHGNLEALDVCVGKMKELGVDHYLCMGDIVGYGANPEECVQIVRDLNAITISGNHDHAVIGCLDIAYFNQYARQAAIWTREHLSDTSKDWLRTRSFVEHMDKFVIVHGSLQAPELFNYVQTVKDAELNFRIMDKNLMFLGHSHQPLAFFNTDPMTYTLDNVIPLDEDVKSIVNVGSVGQPRDEDPRSSFCVYDDEANEAVIYRMEYDIEKTAQKILDAGLPQALALRLSLGK
ncbi:MAG: metallophosphoesterase family protein [Planctomycetes bacterium]|nr:metallophosphoesterase family protein [Planctomycetota bacterium]